jgi:predicted cobalt transporter CbtA
MKPWLKGGLIGAIIGLILYLFVFTAGFGIFSWAGDGAMVFLVLVYPALILWVLTVQKAYGTVTYERYEHAFLLISNIIIWFVIGAIVGWVVGRIKSRKQNY